MAQFSRVSFYPYDPDAQLLSKDVRGFARDLADARSFIRSGMVEQARFRALVEAIPGTACAKYPAFSRAAVGAAIDDFLAGIADG